MKNIGSNRTRPGRTVGLALLVAWAIMTTASAGDREQQWQELNAQAVEAYRAGDYATGVVVAEQAMQLARQTFGPRNPQTLGSLNNLAGLYRAQGRHAEAEPLYKEALQAFREVLGPRHPNTLGSLNNLAVLYRAQGRHAEAEPLFKEALQASREVLGPRHPNTLASLNNLAELYDAQGRHAEAEPLHREALQARREVLGSRHPDALQSLNNLALLYQAQGRLAEAEPLYKEALQASRDVLGPRHPQTLTSINNLAVLYQAQGRLAEAEPLYKEALQARREVLGPRHPDTLQSLNNMAFLYQAQGRLAEAEPLFKEALQASREVLGPRHPQTLTSINNLAVLYQAQGRHAEAEPLSTEALQASREVLGPRHPQTLTTQLNMVVLLANQDRPQDAVRTLQEMESQLLGWIGQELYATEAGAVRRQLVSSQATFQDVALTLATAEKSPEALRLAGTAMLRWKGLQGEEEAYLARLAHRSDSPKIRALASEVNDRRAALAAAARLGEPRAFEMALRALEAKQLALGQISRDYKDHLRVRTANLDDLRAALPGGAALIEFRVFQPVDFKSGSFGEPRLAALLLAGFDEPVLADLGPLAELRATAGALLPQAPSATADEAAAALYRRLFAPFESTLAAQKTVYLAPDGLLHLIPYSRLKLADGRYFEQRQEVRILQTGRDLLRSDPDKPTRGLLALGGIDFGAAATTAVSAKSVFITAAGGADLSGAVTRTAASFGSFGPLPASGEEASQLKDLYLRYRKDEPAEAWTDAAAGETRLKTLKTPPRVLHLATHGFYLEGDAPEPMLLSGVALAGANRALAGKGDDGILFAVEAQGLNLDGSELAALSACDTAKGSLDYSEGVYGLVRALRTAGARNVLVTLWPLNDGEARDFMVAFYKTWLAQAGRSDPAKALRETRLAYITHANPALRDPRVWAPYVLVE